MRPAAYGEAWRRRLTVDRPEGDQHPSVLFGSIVAGEKLLGDLDHQEHKYVVDEYDDALAVDMESFGFGRALHEGRADVRYNPRFAVIRGISDIVHTTPE